MKNLNQDQLKYYLLRNIKEAELFLDPFPHLVIENVLCDEAYENLCINFPEYVNFKGPKRRDFSIEDNNERYQMSQKAIMNKFSKDHPWRIFCEVNSSINFLNDVVEKFKNEISKVYTRNQINIIENINEVNILDYDNNIKNENMPVKSSVTCDINSPTYYKSSVRGPHIDSRDKLYFGLFYMKDKDDPENSGGDLLLYSKKSKFNLVNRDIKKILTEEIEISKIIKYGRNKLVIGLNTEESIHAVSPRIKGAPIRKFSNIVTQLPFNFLKNGA